VGEKRDYSGFERENWEKRTKEHRTAAKQISSCKTKAAAKEPAKTFGVNYHSSLLDLEYFDVVRVQLIYITTNVTIETSRPWVVTSTFVPCATQRPGKLLR